MHESLHHLREILNTLTEMETVSSRRIEEMTSKVESMTEELAGLRSRVEELSNRTSHYPLPHDIFSEVSSRGKMVKHLYPQRVRKIV